MRLGCSRGEERRGLESRRFQGGRHGICLHCQGMQGVKVESGGGRQGAWPENLEGWTRVNEDTEDGR